jgi:hypothetical protein
MYRDACKVGGKDWRAVTPEEARRWICDSPGHLMLQCACTSPFDATSCYECGTSGHISANCPLTLGKNRGWCECRRHFQVRGSRSVLWCFDVGGWRCKPDRLCKE